MESKQPMLTPETISDWWHWWSDLKQNPIYQREFGRWGKPNRFYDSVMKYAPFIILIGIVLGGIGGMIGSFGSLYTEGFVTCLSCFPSILLSIIAFYGFVMGPTLTVPAVNQELVHGSWDILRLTPIGTFPIVMAKLFGSLARLRIWMPLFLLGILQLLISVLGFIIDQFVLGNTNLWQLVLGSVVASFVLFRPMLEFFFAGTLGIYIAFWMRSTELALTVTYLLLIFVKMIFFALSAWITAILLVRGGFPSVLAPTLFPFLLMVEYGVCTAGCLWQIKRKCETVYFSGE